MSLNAPTLPVALATSGPVAATSLSATSLSFTPTANALLIAMTAANNPVSGQDTSVTVTGGGLTWTRRARKNKNASSTGGAGTDGGAEEWTAVAPGSPSAMTVNAVLTTTAQTGSTWDLKLQVVQITDTSGSTPLVGTAAAASSASGLPSVGVAVSAGSYVLAVSSDWATLSGQTLGSGQTNLVNGVNADFAWHFWRTTSTTSAGTQTMNMTAPSAQNYDLVALEVQPPAGGATTFPQRILTIPSPAVTRAATR